MVFKRQEGQGHMYVKAFAEVEIKKRISLKQGRGLFQALSLTNFADEDLCRL